MTSEVQSKQRGSALRGHGLIAQGARFAMSGAFVAGLYVAATFLLSRVLPFQVALLLSFTLAICAHFTLQRVLVWQGDGDYALSVHGQAGRYLLVAATQYAITAAATATIPSALGVPTTAVYLVVTAAVTVANFWLFRTFVFQSDSPAGSARSE